MMGTEKTIERKSKKMKRMENNGKMKKNEKMKEVKENAEMQRKSKK